jgi:predicted transcriptional regulator
LRALLTQSGYSEKSLNNQIFHLSQNGLIKSIGRGKYRATAKAVRLMEAQNGG